MDRQEQLEKLAKLAALVVLETPAHSKWSYHSYVRRSLIEQIDDTLREMGFDVDAARKRMREIEKEAAA